jgi:putative DNA primase/helicase
VIAESGERKTSADRRMRLAAQGWQQEVRDRRVAEVAEADSRVAAWQAEWEGILSKIKSASGGKPNRSGLSIVDLKASLARLETQRPHRVIMPTLFYEDVTPEALAQEIAAGWPSAALWSDEGALVVGSHGMSDDSGYFGLINRFWDGNSFERFRAAAKSFTVNGRRLTCSLMMQHVVLCQLLGAAGGVARGVGFLARFLPAWPHSTMGTRLYQAADLDTAALANWDARIKELLSLPLPADERTMTLNPPTIFLSHGARNHFIAFHDDAERELGRTGQFGEVADFAAKAAENAARLAAVFWALEQGPSGEINAETMEAAAAVEAWHLHEAKRIVGAAKIPQAVADAGIVGRVDAKARTQRRTALGGVTA